MYIISSPRLAAAIAAVITVIAAVAAQHVAAMPDNPCTQGWKDNVIYKSVSCSFDPQVIDWAKPKLVGILFITAVGILVFLGGCIVAAGRCCCNCCGSDKMRPGHFCTGGAHFDQFKAHEVAASYPPKQVLCTKVFVVIGVVLATVATAVAFAGGAGMGLAPNVIREGGVKFTGWIVTTLKQVEADVTASQPQFAGVLSDSQHARDLMDNIRTQCSDFADKISPYTGPMTLGLAAPTAAVAAGSFLLFGSMLCNVQSCLPITVALFTMVMAVPVGALGGVANAAEVLLGVVCDEREAQLKRAPGIMQSYVVPTWCDGELGVAKLRKHLEDAIDSVRSEACTDMSALCSPGANWTGSGPAFECASSACVTLDQLNALFDSTQMKIGYAGEAACESARCSVRQCSDSVCTGALKASATSIITLYSNADRALRGVSHLSANFLDCNVVADRILTDFDVCSTVHAGAQKVSAGAAIGMSACVLIIVFAMRGQKVFFKPPSTLSAAEAEMELMQQTQTQNYQIST